MTMRNPYSYVLLRYRHDPLSGEFLNVGVVLYAPESRFLGTKMRKTLGRLGKAFPGIQKAELTQALSAIERAVGNRQKYLKENSLSREDLKDASAIASSVLPSDDSSYVWSPLRSGLTDDPAKALQIIFDRFVSQYDEENKSGRDDAAVWQPVKELLSARNLIDRLHPKTITSPVDEVEFVNAWKNGVWHCYQPLSFDLSTSEGIREKAARWSGHMTGLSKSDEQIQPYFIVGAPAHAELKRDYSRAIELLKASALEPKVFEENQSDELADLITSQMNRSARA